MVATEDGGDGAVEPRKLARADGNGVDADIINTSGAEGGIDDGSGVVFARAKRRRPAANEPPAMSLRGARVRPAVTSGGDAMLWSYVRRVWETATAAVPKAIRREQLCVAQPRRRSKLRSPERQRVKAFHVRHHTLAGDGTIYLTQIASGHVAIRQIRDRRSTGRRREPLSLA